MRLRRLDDEEVARVDEQHGSGDEHAHGLPSAARRGVHLRVLLDPTQPQNATAFGLLEPAGAAVRFYRQVGDELLHAKLGIFDAAITLFGSCNWSRSGFTRNHELDLLVREPQLARTFLSRMAQDWAVSTP